ncbi:MAG: hypothetical protein ACR2NN_16320 [Bryobacteraceae bacterium]
MVPNKASGPNFVVVSPSSGVTPARASIALNPNVVPYLGSGSYGVLVRFTTPGQSCPPPLSPGQIPCAGLFVDLDLNPQPPPTITSTLSAASLQPAISPGEIVSIFGTHLSTPPVTPQYDSAGLYPMSLGTYTPVFGRMGNTTVTFDGIAAPLLYGSTGQINAQVPYEVAGQKTVNVVVTHNSGASPPFPIAIADTSPAIFTVTQNGNGQGAILNADTGNPYIITVNSVDNPAPKGSAVSIYATGSGLWNRTVQSGSILLDTMTRPAAPVLLTIGGQPARILYAGAAPYLVSGELQVNAIIPDGIGSGPQPLVLTIGQNNNTQQQVTVAVQ